MLSHFLYNSLAQISAAILPLLPATSAKLRQVVAGRKNLFRELEKRLPTAAGKKRIWFHATSVGEFEQARPVIELLKAEDTVSIILSVFSPSVYRAAEKYTHADVVTYLPFDTPANARRFVSLIKPDIFITVKFDVWPNHLIEAKRQGCLTYLIDATLQPKSWKIKPGLAGFYGFVHSHFDHIFAVADDDAARFRRLVKGKTEVAVFGDTRFDQVFRRYCTAREKETPVVFQNHNIKFILGSVWPQDTAVILEPALKAAATGEITLIVVPHEIDEFFIKSIESRCTDFGLTHSRWSQLAAGPAGLDRKTRTVPRDLSVVIVDTVGILAGLYLHTDIAYIGGSFTTGVHNTMEPAICGQPVLFGPVYYNSPEAVKLVSLGSAFPIGTEAEARQMIEHLLTDTGRRKHAGLAARDVIMQSIGAAGKIVKQLRHHL